MPQVNHRWTGWPGAWCLDCGMEDLNEGIIGGFHLYGYDIWLGPIPYIVLASHAVLEEFPRFCTEPGSRNYDPYSSRMSPIVDP